MIQFIPKTIKRVTYLASRVLLRMLSGRLFKMLDSAFVRATKRLISQQRNDVLFQTLNNAGKIILNRPKDLNVINTSMATEMYHQLREWENTKSLVIIKGSGGKAFCAGGDVKIGFNPKLRAALFRAEYKLIYLISQYNIPIVSILDGFTMGTGLGMSVAGRYQIATENLILSMPENKIGLCPDAGGTYFLPRIRCMIGYYLGLTGKTIQGYDAVSVGLATHYVPSRSLEDIEIELSHCSTDQQINILLQNFKETNTLFSLEPYEKDIETCFSASTIEEIIVRLRSIDTDWALKTSEILNTLCPASLKVTLRAFQLGAHMNLMECLLMEYRVTCQATIKPDFFEGVRAVLIDKDNKPKWNPTSLLAVTDEHVDSFFQKFPEELQF